MTTNPAYAQIGLPPEGKRGELFSRLYAKNVQGQRRPAGEALVSAPSCIRSPRKSTSTRL
jgi:hypothetical protein